MELHTSTKAQQLNFQNFHCSIVCTYCSFVCFIIKSGSKIENTSYENEIHKLDSPSNEDSKIYFFVPWRPKHLGEMPKKQEIYCYAN